jgi:hypothetical protein
VAHENFLCVCVCVIVLSAQNITLEEVSVKFNVPTLNCIKILKHLVKKGFVCGVFIGEDRFMCADEHAVGSVVSLATQQGTFSATDVLDLLQKQWQWQ